MALIRCNKSNASSNLLVAVEPGYIYKMGIAGDAQYQKIALANDAATLTSGNTGTAYLINIKGLGYTTLTPTGFGTCAVRGFKSDGTDISLASGTATSPINVSDIELIIMSQYNAGSGASITFTFS